MENKAANVFFLTCAVPSSRLCALCDRGTMHFPVQHASWCFTVCNKGARVINCMICPSTLRIGYLSGTTAVSVCTKFLLNVWEAVWGLKLFKCECVLYVCVFLNRSGSGSSSFCSHRCAPVCVIEIPELLTFPALQVK